MNEPLTDAQLLAFLEENLPSDQCAAIEARLRADPQLLQRLSALRDQECEGHHSLGAIWRRFRLSCPSREQLGQWLLGVLDSEAAEYMRFHIERVGCRYCRANLDDLREQAAAIDQDRPQRRKRFFQTSVGRLPPKR